MKHPKFIVLSVLAIFSATGVCGQELCVPIKHAKLPVVYSLTYHKARPKLLAAGWQPFWTIHYNEADTNPNTSIGNGAIFWRKGYREIEFCAGTGLAPCTFLFKDAYGNKLRVATAGEEFPRQRAYAKVTSYRFVCDPD